MIYLDCSYERVYVVFIVRLRWWYLWLAEFDQGRLFPRQTESLRECVHNLSFQVIHQQQQIRISDRNIHASWWAYATLVIFDLVISHHSSRFLWNQCWMCWIGQHSLLVAVVDHFRVVQKKLEGTKWKHLSSDRRQMFANGSFRFVKVKEIALNYKLVRLSEFQKRFRHSTNGFPIETLVLCEERVWEHWRKK